MRYLLLSLVAFVLMACSSETAYKALPEAPELPSTLQPRQNIDAYVLSTSDIQGLLWPKQINSSNEAAVREVINSSRKLTDLKSKYLVQNQKLKINYKAKACDCALYFICEEGQKAIEVRACEAIEAKKSENLEKLPQIVESLEALKLNVTESGGQWIDINYFNIDIMNSTITLRDEVLSADIEARSFYYHLEAEAKTYKIEMDMTPLEDYLDAIGKIQILEDGQWREGVITFQLPRRL